MERLRPEHVEGRRLERLRELEEHVERLREEDSGSFYNQIVDLVYRGPNACKLVITFFGLLLSVLLTSLLALIVPEKAVVPMCVFLIMVFVVVPFQWVSWITEHRADD